MADTTDSRVAASIEQARALGLPFFLRTAPCKRGHTGPFRVINYSCVTCGNEDEKRRRAERIAARPTAARTVATSARAAAVLAGEMTYLTGRPCKRGHISPRLVGNNTCVQCDLARKVGDPTVIARRHAYYRENRQKMLADTKAYQAENAQAIRVQRKAFREANKERINAKIAEWAKANPAKRRAKERSREGRERGGEGTHTFADIQAIGDRQGWLCAAPWCRIALPARYHVDHIMPLARGGTNWPTNLQLLCEPCNQAKGARDPIEWVQSKGLLL